MRLLVAISVVLSTIAGSASASYMEDFESGSGGWDSFTINGLKSTGGVGDSAYLEGSRTTFAPIFAPSSGAAEAATTGDMNALYGSKIQFSYAARIFQGADSFAMANRFWSGSLDTNGTIWTKDLSPITDAALLMSDWQTISFIIDTTWTDAEATANGWFLLPGRTNDLSWADTMKDVILHEFFTGGTGTSNPGVSHITGIDNVSIQGIPEPSTGLVIAVIGGSIIYGWQRQTRKPI